VPTVSAQDVTTGDGFMFVATEDTSMSAHVADIRDPENPQQVVDIDIPELQGVHNVFYDSGFLYLANLWGSYLGIVDLRTLDPDNPPEEPITEAAWILDGNFVHDMTVQNGRMYVCDFDAGLLVYDVSDVANTLPVEIGSAPGTNTHTAWATDDGAYVVTSEEYEGGGIKAWRIDENGDGTVTLTLTDEVMLDGADSAHDPRVVGYRVYTSWYQLGLQIFDLDSTSGLFTLVGSFDTSSSFMGCWGTYPFNGSHEVLASDMGAGLWIIDALPELLYFVLPDWPPESLDPETPFSFVAQIISGSEMLDPASVVLHYRTDPDDPFIPSPAVQLDDDEFEINLPGFYCGQSVQCYLSAQTTQGTLVTLPEEGENAPWTVPVIGNYPVFVDPFERTWPGRRRMAAAG